MELTEKAASGTAFTLEEAARVLASPDLIDVGTLAESARRARSGDRVTYGRVAVVSTLETAIDAGDAGEVRIAIAIESIDEACHIAATVAKAAAGRVITGFSLGDLLTLVGGDHLALAGVARALRAAGLDAVAEVPLDGLGDTENAIEVVRAVSHGGLGTWRATVTRASLDERLSVIARADELQRATGALRAFAPLPRLDPAETPSTGYDDVHTVAVARLVCAGIPRIQVDWPLYGPKLAQVAITYGADDIDGVAAVDALQLGHRRSPREDIERQIRAAGAAPVERDGRYADRT